MRQATMFCILVPVGMALAGCSQAMRHAERPLSYPSAHKVDQVDDYHGTKVADPYRWLEDPDSPESRAWIDAQNELSGAWLDQIPARAGIKERLTELWNYEKFGVPFKKGGRYFFTKNDGLQNQSVLYTMTALDAEPRVLLDPNTLSEDGTVALTSYAISEDGKHMAYGLSTAGSDWQEWHVRDIETARDLPDRIQWVKFSGASWDHKSEGFYYSRYDEPEGETQLRDVNYFQKVYYHRVGTSQAYDRLVYERPDHKDWGFNGSVTDDGRYLIITVRQGTYRKHRVFYQDLAAGSAEVVELLNDFDAAYYFIDNDGPVFWFQTDLNAPRGRVIAIDTRAPERDNWKEIIPESKDTLRDTNRIGDRLVASYLHDARSQVKVFGLTGKLVHEVAFPALGSAAGFRGRRGDAETFYSFTSFTRPGSVYRYDVHTGQSTVFREPKVKFDPDDYVTTQHFYRSKDGTRVPMFITHKKGLKRTGDTPTYLYGYGGFDIALTPRFSVANLVWMERGGIYAVPNLRGGGEYGREWHHAGVKLKKQNVFDDFIAAAEWLIENDYTRTDKLAIGGGSNGGLLVGACMTQRPDLFGACLPRVGVLDMLRFHKFTIGWAWVSDYGSPDNGDEFEALYAYSPLHNIKPGTAYPPTLITTADHDDRVVPAHSFKFAATLQAAQAGPDPILIAIDTKAGHGAGKPTTKRIDEATDAWAFLVRALKLTP